VVSLAPFAVDRGSRRLADLSFTKLAALVLIRSILWARPLLESSM
jgi:hypothetical protein